MGAQEVSRRTFLAGTTASLIGPGFARADGVCPAQGFYQPLGAPMCNAFVNPKNLQITAQTSSEWCWAATTSNLFAYYNHSVSQETIVQAGIGRLANEPASLNVIESVLNRQWTDTSGRTFTSAAQILYSVDVQNTSLPSNYEFITALQTNHPLLFCNMSHAMMLISINYVPPATQPANVWASIVVDPWPGMGLRALTRQEMTPGHMGGQLRLIMQVNVT